VNLRDLRYFIALADTRHFGQAAARSFVSQPTLSGQLRKLEAELGVALFERTTKSVALTPLGEALLPHAQRAVEEADALTQHARAHRDPLAGPLRVGAIPTLAPYLVPLILAPLHKRHPGLKLVLSEEITAVLLERLRRHQLDVILIATQAEDAELQVRALFDEPFWLALPRKHPFVQKDPITRRDVESLDMLLLSEGHCLAQQTMEICRLADRKDSGEQADLRAASLETLLQLVGAGMGATLVPALALRGAWMTDAGVIARPIKVPDAYRRVLLVWRKGFPRLPAVDALAEVITSNLPNTVRVVKTARSPAPKQTTK
jgi:LysR family hydrogen peroxide-inducible transcriptional activator